MYGIFQENSEERKLYNFIKGTVEVLSSPNPRMNPKELPTLNGDILHLLTLLNKNPRLLRVLYFLLTHSNFALQLPPFSFDEETGENKIQWLNLTIKIHY